MLKAKELRLKSQNDLKGLLGSERAKLRQLRFRLAGAQLKNNQEFKSTRRQIAVLETVLKEFSSKIK